MRRVIQYSAILFISACGFYAYAGGFDYAKEDLSGYNLQPGFTIRNPSEILRSGDSVYFFGGYVYTERFLNSGSKTIYDPINDVTYTYQPKSFFPTTFNGFEVGIGKELTQFINIEIAYNQQFVEKKSGTLMGVPFSTSVKMNGALADVGFVFNPDDPFQVIGKLGVQFSQFTNSASIGLSSATFTFDDSTKIDPAIGFEFLWLFNHNFGARIDTMYVANTQNSNSSGEVNVMAGLNYTV